MIKLSSLSFVVTMAIASSISIGASANPFAFFNLPFQPAERSAPLPPEAHAYQSVPGTEQTTDLPARFKRQIVEYRTNEAPGTIVIDTSNTYLYLVLGNGSAIRYGIGVGRDGYTWSGTQRITKKAEWPDWTPPPEMIQRQPYLPRYMAGGPGNPLGARAMYLGTTIYHTAFTEPTRRLPSMVACPRDASA